MIKEVIEDIAHISTWEDIKKLVRDNKNQLEYLDQYEGLDHFLGSGHYGKVFKIKGKDLTIKVTTDRDEIRESNILRRAGQTNNFINIYEMQIIKPNLAIKVQDLLYPLSGANKRKADEIFQYHKTLEERDIEDFPDPSDIPANLQKFYRTLKQDYEKAGLMLEPGHLDLHDGNFLQDRAGNLKIVDF